MLAGWALGGCRELSRVDGNDGLVLQDGGAADARMHTCVDSEDPALTCHAATSKPHAGVQAGSTAAGMQIDDI